MLLVAVPVCIQWESLVKRRDGHELGSVQEAKHFMSSCRIHTDMSNTKLCKRFGVIFSHNLSNIGEMGIKCRCSLLTLTFHTVWLGLTPVVLAIQHISTLIEVTAGKISAIQPTSSQNHLLRAEKENRSWMWWNIFSTFTLPLHTFHWIPSLMIREL